MIFLLKPVWTEPIVHHALSGYFHFVVVVAFHSRLHSVLAFRYKHFWYRICGSHSFDVHDNHMQILAPSKGEILSE